jgi:hypothetical protein
MPSGSHKSLHMLSSRSHTHGGHRATLMAGPGHAGLQAIQLLQIATANLQPGFDSQPIRQAAAQQSNTKQSQDARWMLHSFCWAQTASCNLP